jgi:hypothetical protein
VETRKNMNSEFLIKRRVGSIGPQCAVVLLSISAAALLLVGCDEKPAATTSAPQPAPTAPAVVESQPTTRAAAPELPDIGHSPATSSPTAGGLVKDSNKQSRSNTGELPDITTGASVPIDDTGGLVKEKKPE